MLRLLILLSLCLLLIFTAIGLALSREWGWSEYASDELYVVSSYYSTMHHPKYLITNADGSSNPEALSWRNGVITNLGCSPDGRTLAYLTDTQHLFAVTHLGITYEKQLDRRYDTVEVMNNQTIVLSYDDYLYELVVNADDSFSITMPKYHHRLAPDQVYVAKNSYGEPYLEDSTTGFSVQLDYYPSPVFSPDMTKVAVSTPDTDNQSQWHTYIIDFLSQERVIQIPDSPDFSYSPFCFLTFRPEMLLADSQ